MICRTLTVATLIAVCYFRGALAATTIGDLTSTITAGGGGSPLTVDSQESSGIAISQGLLPEHGRLTMPPARPCLSPSRPTPSRDLGRPLSERPLTTAWP
jgi:hypothetical protein